MIQLNPRGGTPIYRQVVEQIKHLIAAGRLRPDDQLPTVRQLAADLRVNPNTIARAYAQLAEEGVISTQQGRGTYVLDVPPSIDQRKIRREKLIVMVDRVLQDIERLNYTPDEVEKVWRDRLAVWRKSQSRKL